MALLLVGGGGWLVAGRALRPLRTIAQTAERVTARGLDQRIPAANEDKEITRLIGVLNGMMDRLEASFNQATRFSADASHELKTPLAIMQGELENALQAAQNGKALLTLCNTGAGIPPAHQPRIFDRFYRVRQSDSGSRESLALGLSLAREIMHAHQGEVALKESRPGYTCFTLALRLHPAR